MEGSERREQIKEKLKKSKKPLSASALAADFSVSRQIIVGDIALLRAAGVDILATARGYLLDQDAGSGRLIRRIACSHKADQMQEELYAMVDEGCKVLDVIVEHPIYSELTGRLQLSSRHDVDQFIERSCSVDALPLSALTEGIHLHTLSCPDAAAYDRVKAKLDSLGILIKD